MTAILFDLDGTLLGAYEEKGKVRNRIAEELGAPRIKNEDYYEVLRQVVHNRKLDNRIPIFEKIFGDGELAKEYAKRYRKESLENAYLHPDAKAVLENMEVKKGLITNGPGSIQREKIEKFDLGKYFDFIAISGEIGKAKPDKDIFEITLDQLGASRDGGMFVGNIPELDIQGGKNAGLTTVLIDRNGDFPNAQPDYRIKDLRELEEIVDSF